MYAFEARVCVRIRLSHFSIGAVPDEMVFLGLFCACFVAKLSSNTAGLVLNCIVIRAGGFSLGVVENVIKMI